MTNPHRSEVTAVLDGRRRRLKLTLNALAELEAALEAPDLSALAARFESGRPKTADLLEVIAAALRAGEGDSTIDARLVGESDLSAAAAARLAASLLQAAFLSVAEGAT